MDFVPVAALGAVVYAAVTFLRNLTSGEWKSAATQTTSWVAGVAGVFLVGATQWAHTITITGLSLSSMSGWSKVLCGFMVASTGNLLNDGKNALDNTASAAVPALFTRKAKPVDGAAAPEPTAMTPLAAAQRSATNG
jgi:hypothetical protein